MPDGDGQEGDGRQRIGSGGEDSEVAEVDLAAL
jgi:hypothetical protein